MEDFREKKYWLVLAGLWALRLLLALSCDLTPDEAYYWELSRRLDFSYFDHPPMVAYFIAICRAVFGDTAFAVRVPALMGIICVSGSLYAIGKNFSGKAFTGFLAALIINLTPAGIALGFITTPDVPLALFWSFGIWSFLKVIDSDDWLSWIGVGVCLGAGALSKYNMIFFCPAVALVILGFSRRRPSLVSGKFWVMVLLAFVGTLPILYWNMQHDWISFRFQFQHGFKESQRSSLGSFGEFIGGQLGTIGPLLFPALWLIVFFTLWKAWRDNDEKRFFLASLAFPMMAFFAYNSLNSKVEANWPQVAYLSAIPLLAEWLTQSALLKRFLSVVGPSLLLSVLVVTQALFCILPLPPRMDISIRLHGWTELGEMVREIDQKTGGKNLFVGQGAPLTALVSFYGKLPPDRIAEVHGTGNWKFWWNNRSIATGAEVIYVDDDRLSEAGPFSRYFERTLASFSRVITMRSRPIRTLNLTHFSGFKGGGIFN